MNNEITLAPKQSLASKLTPRNLLGANLLFVPLVGLTDECRRLLGDNPFVSFAPPRWQTASVEIDEELSDSLPAAEDMDAHLALQIRTCPGFPQNIPAEAGFWSSLLDTRGYLNTSPAEISRLLGADEAVVGAALAALRNYVEPAGLFAESLRECLAIQLERRREADSDAALLLAESWEALSAGRGAAFARRAGWNTERYTDALAMLKTLDPEPGRNFNAARNAVPEVEFIADSGSVAVKLLCANLPVPGNDFADFPFDAQELLNQRWTAGPWSRAKFVLNRLGLRYRTLLRISMLIASVQARYILGLAGAQAPLTYAAAAGPLGLSASTVCRAVKDVWCLAGGSLAPLSLFFSRAASACPAESVKELRLRIATLNSDGLSDSMIAARLRVPARTVSYHRSRMGLKTSKRRG